MSSFRYLALLLVSGSALAAGDGFMIGGGVESDTQDSLAAAVLGTVGLTEETWLSAGVARSSVELTRRREIEALYADVELDHYFGPVGVRIGAAYWGDDDVLESNDWRASLYWRNDSVMLAAEYEYRDFDFIIPSIDFTSVRKLVFDADGIGLSARFKTGDNTSLRLSGKKYDYSVPFRPIDNADAASLVTVTRLSLINSLIDHRAGIAFSIDQGENNWEFELMTWEGVLDGSRTTSYTLRFLTPMSNSADIELGLGHDDSELYGDVTFFSVYLFFYGAN